MSGIYIDGISLGENHWAIISKFFRAVVGPTDTTVEGRFVEEHGKIWLILNGERHAVTQVPDHGRLIDADAFENRNAYFWNLDFINPKYPDTLANLVNSAPTIIPAEEEAEE